MSTRRRPSRRTVRRTAGTTLALGVLGLFGQFLGLIGTLGAAGLTAAGGATVAYIEYRRDFKIVKHTGKPVDRAPVEQWKADQCKGCGGKIRIPVGQQAGISRCGNCPDPPRRRPARPPQQPQQAGSVKAPPTPLFMAQPEPVQPTRPIRRPASKAKTWPPPGHNPKCEAKSAATCKCPKGRQGAKRKVS